MIRKSDVFVVFFVALALYYFSKKNYPIAYAVITFASLIKMNPVLIFLLFLIINILNREDVDRGRTVFSGIATA